MGSALDRRGLVEALASDVWLETTQVERALTAADNVIRLDTPISETSVDVSNLDIYKSVTPGRLPRTR